VCYRVKWMDLQLAVINQNRLKTAFGSVYNVSGTGLI